MGGQIQQILGLQFWHVAGQDHHGVDGLRQGGNPGADRGGHAFSRIWDRDHLGAAGGRAARMRRAGQGHIAGQLGLCCTAADQ